ncbi:hypothetical protein NDU88_007463 [Pleurodeles waltl]|uniref:Uncharacterized protein n=1 Tax=Pleurodeles waltl TaxID=8319 RepID=A0AAV7RTB3_PLEWA|nr:hypothetical protein NDU88_007463 [Pleurodeles waltl]
MAERTSRHPRRRNAIRPTTLQEKRGSLRCVQGGRKGVQEGREVGRRREQKPRGSGRTGGEGNKNQGGVGGREKKGKGKQKETPTQDITWTEENYPAVEKNPR